MSDHGEPVDPEGDLDTKHLTDVTEAYEETTEEERQARLEAIYNRGRFQGLQIDPDVEFYPEVAGRKPGDGNIEGRGFDLHPHVTFWSAGILLVFVALTLGFSGTAEDVFSSVLNGINDNFGWLFIMAGNIFVLAAIYFAATRFSKIRIGGPNAKPEFSTPAWYAMLISAGMGIGLLFWSVAEPIFHLDSPAPFFDLEGGDRASGRAAMVTTFYHWGIHPWAIYALVALALSFFAYNRGLPLTFRSVFYPILKERIYGPWGNAIDILTVLATLFGLATSLGLGVGQAAAGLNHVFGTPDDTWFQVVLIAGITGLATISVMAGLDAGVKRLSQINMGLAIAFMIFILIVGPTLFILSLFSQGTGSYLGTLPELAFWNEAFEDTNWQGNWTVFYWGWWISWSPFVGMFIARISKGRTVREIVLGVILFPSALSFFWMSVFGGSAIDLELGGVTAISEAAFADAATAMFAMLDEFPLAAATSVLGIILVMSFFVTSSDSGSLVVDHLTSGGKLDSPRPQRVFWAVMEGLLAAVLLIGGGLAALQTAAVATGLPFAVVLLVMIWSLRRAFHQELELLEGHYDADQFRSRHAALLQRAMGRGKETVRTAATKARGRSRRMTGPPPERSDGSPAGTVLTDDDEGGEGD